MKAEKEIRELYDKYKKEIEMTWPARYSPYALGVYNTLCWILDEEDKIKHGP